MDQYELATLKKTFMDIFNEPEGDMTWASFPPTIEKKFENIITVLNNRGSPTNGNAVLVNFCDIVSDSLDSEDLDKATAVRLAEAMVRTTEKDRDGGGLGLRITGDFGKFDSAGVDLATEATNSVRDGEAGSGGSGGGAGGDGGGEGGGEGPVGPIDGGDNGGGGEIGGGGEVGGGGELGGQGVR